MQVKLTTTTKRENSTYIPTFSTTLQCRLKAPSSVMNPTLMFDRENVGNNYNYAYIPEFDRYYFVVNIVYAGALVEYDLRCDVLASFKATIGASTQYVLRAASEYDGTIIDTRYPLTTEIQKSSTALSQTWYDYGAGRGDWVIGIAGNTSVKYYAFSYAAMLQFFSYLLSDSYVTDILNSYIIDALVHPEIKMTVDPLQYITSIVWMPFSVSGNNTTQSVPVGNVDISVTNGTVLNLGYTDNIEPFNETLSFTDHPLAATRGSYMNSSGYTECTLHAPPFGTFDLDVVSLKQADSVNMHIAVDVTTGGGILEIREMGTISGVSTVVNVPVRASAQIGVSIPVSQVITKGWNAISAVGGVLGSIAGSSSRAELAMNAIGSVYNAIGDYAESKVPKVRTTGSKGDLSDLKGYFKIMYDWYIPVDDDNSQHGRPLCQVKQISTLSGFIMCDSGTEVQITGTAEEQEQIISYMTGGFYYE